MNYAQTIIRRAAVTTLLVLLSSPARAQSPDAALAEKLFEEGRTLAAEKQWNAACEKFQASQDLQAKLGTLLNLAVCREQQGNFASAWAAFKSVTTLARRAGASDRAKFAQERVEILGAKVATLKLLLPNGTIELQLDGKALNRAAFQTAIPLDPGKHRLSATAPGKKAWSTEVVIPSEKQEVVIQVPPLENAPAPVPAPEPVEVHSSTNYTTFIAVSFAVAGAGALVGGITGGLTLANAGELKDACRANGGPCPVDQAATLDETNTLADVSTAAFVVAGVGAAAGIVGLILGASGDDGDQAEHSLVPIVAPGYIGLHGRF